MVATNPLKSPKTIMQRMGENMNGGFVPIDKATIHPNFLARVQHTVGTNSFLRINDHTYLVYISGSVACQRQYLFTSLGAIFLTGFQFAWYKRYL